MQLQLSPCECSQQRGMFWWFNKIKFKLEKNKNPANILRHKLVCITLLLRLYSHIVQPRHSYIHLSAANILETTSCHSCHLKNWCVASLQFAAILSFTHIWTTIAFQLQSIYTIVMASQNDVCSSYDWSWSLKQLCICT